MSRARLKMSIYINMFLEQFKNGKWEYIREIKISQNYDLYSLIDGTVDFYRANPIVGNDNYIYDSNIDASNSDFEVWLKGFTMKDIINYKYWDAYFNDTRKPIKKNELDVPKITGKFLRGYNDLDSELNFQSYTPNQLIKRLHSDWSKILKALELPNSRIVFYYDC